VSGRGVLVVGGGYAGTRFCRALRFLERETDLELRGLVDPAPSPRAADPGLPHHRHLADAMRLARPDIVVVAVNEYAHCEVLVELARYAPRTILCEKPLASSMAECARVAEALGKTRLCLNLVERFSHALEAALAWLRGLPPTARVERVEFFWGKHRIHDPRPTIGVVSELIHPIDLVDVLVGLGDLRVLGITSSTFDLSRAALGIEDALDFDAVTGAGCSVRGHVSFSWPRRQRMVTAIVRDRQQLYRLIIDFDHPHWDDDAFRVEAIDSELGLYETVAEASWHAADVPLEIRGIAKVVEFVRASCDLPRRSTLSPEPIGLHQAIALQAQLTRFSRPSEVAA
jgi:predicted dehydrogenase